MLIHKPLKKRFRDFIFKILLISFVFIKIFSFENNSDKNFDDTITVFNNQYFSDVLKIAVPTIVVGGVILISLNKDLRWYFADRWTRFTSPNHADPSQARDFYFKPLSEEIAQETQCDKGVHFIFSYLPVLPLATLFDRSYNIMTTGKIPKKISNWSVILSSSVVVGFGVLEEYMDGHQKGEGFSVYDLTANILGVFNALLKHYGYLENVAFYWSFNREMFRNSEYYTKWPWWIYMAGYEFYVNIDIYPFIEKNLVKKDKMLYNLVETIGYLPDFKGFWELRFER
ncbi:MAG: hypothetical protein ABIN39_07135 [candidate division WOR-3 bacterium]